jgi:hypothetical protein
MAELLASPGKTPIFERIGFGVYVALMYLMEPVFLLRAHLDSIV